MASNVDADVMCSVAGCGEGAEFDSPALYCDEHWSRWWADGTGEDWREALAETRALWRRGGATP